MVRLKGFIKKNQKGAISHEKLPGRDDPGRARCFPLEMNSSKGREGKAENPCRCRSPVVAIESLSAPLGPGAFTFPLCRVLGQRARCGAKVEGHVLPSPSLQARSGLDPGVISQHQEGKAALVDKAEALCFTSRRREEFNLGSFRECGSEETISKEQLAGFLGAVPFALA